MKIKIKKSFDIEVLGLNYNMTYEEAKYLYEELHKEFGKPSETFLPNMLHYPTSVRRDITYGGIHTAG